MSHPLRKSAGLLLLALLLVGSGCSTVKMPEVPVISNIWPETLGGRIDKSKLIAQYGDPPSKRLEHLTKLEQEARNYSPQNQQRATDQLTAQIQQESDPVMRRQIIRSMRYLRTPGADYLLRAGLHGDKDTSVRVTCCEVLGQRGGPEATRELVTILSHEKNIDVRLAAVRALGEIGDPNVVPALGVALQPKEDPALQHRTAQVLADLTGKDYGNDLVAWRSYVATGVVPPARSVPTLADRARSLRWW